MSKIQMLEGVETRDAPYENSLASRGKDLVVANELTRPKSSTVDDDINGKLTLGGEEFDGLVDATEMTGVDRASAIFAESREQVGEIVGRVDPVQSSVSSGRSICDGRAHIMVEKDTP